MARTSSKILKAIPSSEIGKLICYTEQNSSGDKYFITQNQLKKQFTLWKCLDDGFERIKVSDNPLELDRMIPYKM